MSKIQQIQPKYETRDLSTENVNCASKQSFGRFNVEDIPKDTWEMIEKGTEKGLHEQSKALAWCFEKLGKTKGEVQTQIINNLFTATLAPYVIYNNPFTDKSKEDRAYLAWRQPLSSVTAFTVNLPLTLLMNAYMNKTYNEGYNKSIDLRWNPDKGYIKKQFKKEKGIKKPSFLFSKEEKAEFKIFLDGLKSKDGKEDIKGFKDKRIETFTKLFSEDPGKDNANFEIDEKTKTLYINREGKKVEIGKNIPNISTDKELKTFLNENNFYNRTVGDLLEKEFFLETYKKGDLKGQLKPVVAQETLSKSKAVDFVKAIGMVDGDKVDDSAFREIISKYRQGKKMPELAKSLFGSDSAENIAKAKSVFEIFAQDGARSNEMIMGEKLGKGTNTTLGQFLHQLGYKVSPTKDGDKSIQDLADMKIKDFLEELNKKLNPIGDMFKKSKEIGKAADGKSIKQKVPQELSDFAGSMLKRLGERNKSYAGTHKTKVAMVLNVFIMYITCTALNWLYPRFMNKFKPNLVQSRKEGGDK